MEKIDVKLVEQLADLMAEKELSYLEIDAQKDETKIIMTRANDPMQMANSPYFHTEIETRPNIIGYADSATEIAVDLEKTPELKTKAIGEELKSPLVGVAFLALSPEAEPLVSVGTIVKKGQQLCILEAMKVMNEFNAPRDGEIVEICVEDGELVEFGQCIFRLK